MRYGFIPTYAWNGIAQSYAWLDRHPDVHAMELRQNLCGEVWVDNLRVYQGVIDKLIF